MFRIDIVKKLASKTPEGKIKFVFGSTSMEKKKKKKNK